ncbi:hypothetical protein INT44_000567 [Umbelopsis vinacea]|uniref:Uncharacterized protein n=1 Tax=Umbelopsis vinacea TaxID=44442 RepID=A0A8H7PLA5_9FUNG|nr:hypothetical protein INT44_000567 [Umbelopsis vinacea]
MAPSMKEPDTLDTADMRNAHHMDDIFLIDMSEDGMTPGAPSSMKADPDSISRNPGKKRAIQQIVKVRLWLFIRWTNIIYRVLIHAFYAIVQSVSLKSFADPARDQVMNHVLEHLTKPEFCISGIDRRYMLNNVLLCGLLSRHIKTVLTREGSERRHLLLLKALDYGVQRLEYEFGDAARMYANISNYTHQSRELGAPWPLLEERYIYDRSKYIYEDFCIAMLYRASFDLFVDTVGNIRYYGAHNMASHESLDVQYLVRHVIFSTVLTQDYSVLYASGGDISCLETELVAVLRQDSENQFSIIRELLHNHIRIKLDNEINHIELGNLQVTYLSAASTKLSLKKKKNRILVHYRSAESGRRNAHDIARKTEPTRHTSTRKIIIHDKMSMEARDDRTIAVVGHEFAVFTPPSMNSNPPYALWARLHLDGFIVKDRLLVGTYFAVIAAAITIAIWQTSEALRTGKLSGIDITSAASLYLVVTGIVTTIFKTTRAVEWSWFDFVRMQHKSRAFIFTHEERCVTYSEILALAASYDKYDKHAMLGKSNLTFLQDQEFTGNVMLPWPLPIGSLIASGFLLLKEYSTGSLYLVVTTRGVYGANSVYSYSDYAKVFKCEETSHGICHITQEVDYDSLLFGELGFAALRVS